MKLFLPNGASFKENINLTCLKSLYALIWQLSCVKHSFTCDHCNEECEYHKSTGENFQYYPGILVYNDLFTRRVYAKGESIRIQFYLIGNNQKYANYIRLLFELYLKGEIAGQSYILEKIDIVEMEVKDIHLYKMNIQSIIESQNFIQSYNKMMKYYNEKYATDFRLLEHIDYRIDSFKRSSMDHLSIGNQNINPRGFLYRIEFSQEIEIEDIVKQIGIGKFSFIGGGRYED